MAAYYLRAVAPAWGLGQIYRGMLDFMILQVIGLIVVFMFPQVALWLPELLFGR
jgi:TRAP-type mannitol/chloroaromatic compound transport system permease large subunit